MTVAFHVAGARLSLFARVCVLVERGEQLLHKLGVQFAPVGKVNPRWRLPGPRNLSPNSSNGAGRSGKPSSIKGAG